MKNISEILQDKAFDDKHRLFEIATISRPNDNLPRSARICVCGENDEQGTKTPHFHVLIDNGDIELEVAFRHVKELNIWRTKRNYPKSWDGLSNVKKAIQDWLAKPHHKFNNFTNLQYMVQAWNDNNPSNEITDDYLK